MRRKEINMTKEEFRRLAGAMIGLTVAAVAANAQTAAGWYVAAVVGMVAITLNTIL